MNIAINGLKAPYEIKDDALHIRYHDKPSIEHAVDSQDQKLIIQYEIPKLPKPLWIPLLQNNADQTEGVDIYFQQTPAPNTSIICSGEDLGDGHFKLQDVQHSIYWTSGRFAVQTVTHGFITSGGTSTVKAHLYVPVEYQKALGLLAVQLQKAYEFLNGYIGVSFPYKSYRMCFVDGLSLLSDDLVDGVSLSLLSSHHLCNEITEVAGTPQFAVLESVPVLRSVMSRALAAQWFGAYIYPKDVKRDNWIVEGISGFLSGLFHQHTYGTNDYKYRLYKDMERICELNDLLPLHPLLDKYGDHFVRDSRLLGLKSPIVLYILSRFIGRVMTQRLINRIMVAGISGELPEGLSTQQFLKMIKRISGKETKYFSDQWIFGKGVPQLSATHHFNRKKNIIELRIRQLNLECLYNGNVTVRVHEPDGTYDHVVRVEDVTHQFDLNYHTKYKRLRIANKKSDAGMGNAEENAIIEPDIVQGLLPPPGCEIDEMMNQVDPELSQIIASSQYDENDTEALLLNSPINWIRIDPDLDLCFRIPLESQTLYMIVQQLTKDRDSIAQIEAVRQLSNCPSGEADIKRAAANLLATMVNVRLYYQVRIEAARALANYKQRGMHYLFMVYRKKFCISSTAMSNSGVLIPRRNDFSVITEYHLQTCIPEVLGTMRDNNDQGIVDIQRFILTLLKMNDNSSNAYQDVCYIASLITALGVSFVPAVSAVTSTGQPQEMLQSDIFLQALAEIDRHLFLETQVPTWHNAVACACLQTLMRWRIHDLLPESYNTLRPFILFSASENYVDVRLVSFNALMTFGYSDPLIWDHILDVVSHEDLSFLLLLRLVQFLQILKNTYEQEMDIQYAKAAEDYKKRVNQDKLVVDVEDLSGGASGQEQVATAQTDYLLLKRFYAYLSLDIQKRLLQISQTFPRNDEQIINALLDCAEALNVKAEMSTDIRKLKLQVPQKPEPVQQIPKLRVVLNMKPQAQAKPTQVAALQQSDALVNSIVPVEPISQDIANQPVNGHHKRTLSEENLQVPQVKKIKLKLFQKPKPPQSEVVDLTDAVVDTKTDSQSSAPVFEKYIEETRINADAQVSKEKPAANDIEPVLNVSDYKTEIQKVPEAVANVAEEFLVNQVEPKAMELRTEVPVKVKLNTESIVQPKAPSTDLQRNEEAVAEVVPKKVLPKIRLSFAKLKNAHGNK